MPFDGIVTAAVVHELNTLLSDGRIDKVYQPDPQDIVLSVHRGKDKYKVLLSANSSDARIQLMSQTPPNPPQPPSFCMLLRKHIHGARIRQVIQIDSERIVEFGKGRIQEPAGFLLRIHAPGAQQGAHPSGEGTQGGQVGRSTGSKFTVHHSASTIHRRVRR